MILTIHESGTITPITKFSMFSDLSIFWRYHDVGEMRLVLPVDEGLALRPGMFISQFNGDLTIGNECFIVDSVRISEQETGDKLHVTAFTASYLLQYRSIFNERLFEGKGGQVIKDILDLTFAEQNRRFPKFSYDIDTSLGDEVSYQSTPMTVLEAITIICKASGLGFYTEFDPHTYNMVFKIRQGADRTGTDPNYTPVIFEAALQNISRVIYTESTRGFATMAYVLGERYEDTDVRRMVTYDPNDLSGYDRFEVVLESGKTMTTDQRLPSGEYKKLTESQYLQVLTDYGRDQVGIRQRTRAAEGELRTEKGLLVLNKDYFLGDIVIVRSNRWNMTIEPRMIELVEDYSNGVLKVHVTIGDRKPALTDLISRL